MSDKAPSLVHCCFCCWRFLWRNHHSDAPFPAPEEVSREAGPSGAAGEQSAGRCSAGGGSVLKSARATLGRLCRRPRGAAAPGGRIHFQHPHPHPHPTPAPALARSGRRNHLAANMQPKPADGSLSPSVALEPARTPHGHHSWPGAPFLVPIALLALGPAPRCAASGAFRPTGRPLGRIQSLELEQSVSCSCRWLFVLGHRPYQVSSCALTGLKLKQVAGQPQLTANQPTNKQTETSPPHQTARGRTEAGP